MGWLSTASVLIALPAYALIFAATAVLGHSVFRRFVPPERLREQYDVAGFLVSVVGVLYSVVLGFLVGTVWTAFSAAQDTTNLEAGYVADAFNFARQVPEPQRTELETILARYAFEVRDIEPPMLGARREDARAIALMNRAVRITVTMPAPKTRNPGEILESSMLRTALMGNLRNIGDQRRLRMLQAQSRLPPGMYEALLLGAALVIAFAFFFGIRSYFKQMAMTALVAASIGLFFGLIVELSTPYSGSIQVSRDAWTLIIDNNHMAAFVK
jgi:hypothetical protein